MARRWRIDFEDDTSEELEAVDGDQAKNTAKAKRVQALNPTGGMNRADVNAHKTVKVRRVVEIATMIAAFAVQALAMYALGALEAALGGRVEGLQYAGVLALVTAQGTAITATLSALTASTGDSLAVPFFPDAKKAWLLQVWADVQVAGTLRIRSPKFHDNVNGMRFDTIISDPTPMLPGVVGQRIYPGDNLIVELAGSAVAGDIEYACMLQYFEELSAQHSKLIGLDELERRTLNILTVENTLATGTGGGYTGSEAINAEIDQFQQNTEYAILGYHVDAEGAAIGYRSPDSANVRLGGPAIETDRELTRDWFVHLTRTSKMPLIPVFNGSNKAAVNVDAVQDENGTDITVTTILAQLAKA